MALLQFSRATLFITALWTISNAYPIADIKNALSQQSLAEIIVKAEGQLATRGQVKADKTMNKWFDNKTTAKWLEKKDLFKRARGDENNPIDVTIDVSGWKDIAEENCYQMLCHHDAQLIW